MTLVLQFIRMRLNVHETDAFVRHWRAVRGVDHVRIKEEDVGLPEHAMYDGDGRQRANPCHVLWRGPFCVRYTGDVYPCSPMATGGAPPLGNLRTASLGELWNSPEMQRLRTLHAERRHMEEPLCAGCHCLRPRLPLVLGGMAVPGTTLRRLIPVAEGIGRRLPRLVSERRTPK
jgi:radical SAM protein with 4Fe4S-binding SPASM domain